jgi:hypothetical protein
MGQRPIHPDIILADLFLSYMPRTGKTSKSDLLTALFKEYPQGYTSYRDYFEVALEILLAEKYIEVIDSSNDINAATEYRLTNAGRTLQDTGGYLKKYKEKLEKEAFDRKVSTAEGQKKIFDNKVKVILFIIIILSALVGLLGKRLSNSEKKMAETQNLPTQDSFFSPLQDQTKPAISSTLSNKQQEDISQVELRPQTNDSSHFISSKSTKPIQIATADNIEFKLIKVTGNSKAQSITCTMVLTTSAANWYIMSHVKSIIDGEGNEYKLKSFTIGASDYFPKVDLITGIPIKCTYTFGGVLPDVKAIKLFKYDYTHSAGEPFAVEFRDIPVDWQ